MTIRNILAATDFSERAARAETRAAMLCRQLQCEALELLHVNPPRLPSPVERSLNVNMENIKTLSLDQAVRRLQAAAQRLSKSHDVQCAQMLRSGSPAVEIVARADEIPADLTAIGAHGADFLTTVFLGNQADRLARMIRRPLLIVKEAPRLPYQSVLIPTDFSEDSLYAAQVALQMAPDARITVLHAYQIPYESQLLDAHMSQSMIDHYRMQAAEETRANLSRFVERLDTGPRRLSQMVEYGSASMVILHFAKLVKPDLIAMGKHGQSRFQELLMGSATRAAIDQINCDVLTATLPTGTGSSFVSDTL